MTKIIEGITVLTYEEWEKKPEARQLLGDTDDCDECDGTGEHECSCGDTHDCRACDGSGKDGGVNLRDIYEESLRNEVKKLIAWREGLAIKNPSLDIQKDSEPVTPVKISIHGKDASGLTE